MPTSARGFSRALAVALAAALSLAGMTSGVGRAQSATPASPTAGSIIVTGRVFEADGTTPVASAVVSLLVRTASTDPDRVLTDADGRFFFASVSAGRYSLAAEKPGYEATAFGQHRPDGPSLPLDLTEGRPVTNVALLLWRHAVLTGRVLDDLGEPMVGVTVRALRLGWIGGHRHAVVASRTRTDDSGTYRFASLVPGPYVVALAATVTSEPATLARVVRTDGDVPTSLLQTMTGVGTAPITFDRATGITHTPSVLVASALAVLSEPPVDGPWSSYPTTYAPTATSLSAATVFTGVSGEVQTLPDLVARLVPTYCVSGVVTGPDGPADFYAVHLVPADAADAPVIDTAVAVTGADGTFTLEGVPAGAYIARVVKTPFPPGPRGMLSVATEIGVGEHVIAQGVGRGAGVPTEALLSAAQPITVTDRNVRGVALTLATGPRVTGHAVFTGATKPPTSGDWAGFGVTLEPANGDFFAAVFPGRFDERGQFATPSSWPARYVIRATGPADWTFVGATYQGRDVSETPVDLTSDLEGVVVTFTDHVATIAGNVQKGDGQPAAGSAVVLFPANPARWLDYGRSSRSVREVVASPTGAFQLPAPPAGEYLLAAIPEGEATSWRDPAFLARLAAVADHLSISDGQSLSHLLHERSVR